MQRLPRIGVVVIGEAEKRALFAHYFADGGVVDMADLRKEVMLYLKIQSPGQPGNDFVTGGEIGSGSDLMDRPFGIYALVGVVGYTKTGQLHHVRQLKYNRQGKPHDHVDDEKAYQPGLPTQHIYREEYIEKSIHQLAGPKYQVLLNIDPCDRRCMNSPFKVSDEIGLQHP